MFFLRDYVELARQKLDGQRLEEQGWSPADASVDWAPGYRLAVGIDELSGGILRGLACYDSGRQQWLYLDPLWRVVLVDKIILYVKPVSALARQKHQQELPWIALAPPV